MKRLRAHALLGGKKLGEALDDLIGLALGHAEPRLEPAVIERPTDLDGPP